VNREACSSSIMSYLLLEMKRRRHPPIIHLLLLLGIKRRWWNSIEIRHSRQTREVKRLLLLKKFESREDRVLLRLLLVRLDKWTLLENNSNNKDLTV
jgi:hypothetical protein